MANEISYGIHSVESLLEKAPEHIDYIVLLKGAPGGKLKKLAALANKRGVNIVYHPKPAIDQMAKTSKHQGALAVSRKVSVMMDESDVLALVESAEHPVCLLILDGVQDPHNLGACLRSAAAAGVDAVIAPKDKSVGLTPVVRKVASGGAEVCPFVQVTNLSRFMAQIKELGVWLYGAEANPDQTIFDVDLTTSVAWVMGAEGAGLRLGTRKACDFGVSIPMPGTMESLNVSVAAGICLFETVRQRRK